MELSSTPSGNRIHIALFGKRNSGKSSLMNALAGQTVSLVSDYAGTTTDPVQKAVEIHPIGPCLLIDTAGFDDEGDLGKLRVEQTTKILSNSDIAVLLFSDNDFSYEAQWIEMLQKRRIPIVAVANKCDLADLSNLIKEIHEQFHLSAIPVSAKTGQNLENLRQAIIRVVPDKFETSTIVGNLVKDSDCVLLVMPQDIQAPKGRLILPQVQTIRDLLDHKCSVVCCEADRLEQTLNLLKEPPKLIITDSQVFPLAYAKKPDNSLLTSFSVLFAAYKGDIKAFAEGSRAIWNLTDNSKVLIAEACAHNPLDGDIGRQKIPALLRKKTGKKLQIDVVSGADFPADLTCYDLIIHCGACMFTRRYVLNRLEQAKKQGVPMTNYGIAIAALTGILDKIVM